ncbi:MAG: SIMPL domain-containing protein [Gammaproteobacteria bacterium]
MPASIILLLCAIVALPAVADDDGPRRNLVSLSVAASEEVDSDLLVVRLSAQHESSRQAEAANRVNETMSWALAAAAAVAAVEATTLDYRTNPVYEERRIRAWRVQQSLRLESADRSALTALLGTLQERLAIESLGYEVSDAVREATEERLIERAIAAFRARAARVTTAFGRSGYGLVNVNLGSSGYQPHPPMPYQGRMLAMEAKVAEPAIEAGQQTITVNVDGTIELALD